MEIRFRHGQSPHDREVIEHIFFSNNTWKCETKHVNRYKIKKTAKIIGTNYQTGLQEQTVLTKQSPIVSD